MSDGALRRATALLGVAGIGVAGYLTYVHYAGLDPVCVGGGGGCAIVQASEQSELLGVPVALLGLLAYVTIVIASAFRVEPALLLAALVAFTGFGFSVYLTIESVTVIEATCQWCLASLALMTLLAVVSGLRLLRAD